MATLVNKMNREVKVIIPNMREFRVFYSDNEGSVMFFKRDWTEEATKKEEHWKPSEQEKGALQTAIHILTDGGSIAFTKAAEQLQNILNAFEGKESRKDWKPSEEQIECLRNVVHEAKLKHEASVGGYADYQHLRSLLQELIKQL